MQILLFPFKAIRLFFRLSGVKGGLLFGFGVAIGLLIAPQTGAELRMRLQSRVDAARGGPEPLSAEGLTP